MESPPKEKHYILALSSHAQLLKTAGIKREPEFVLLAARSGCSRLLLVPASLQCVRPGGFQA